MCYNNNGIFVAERVASPQDAEGAEDGSSFTCHQVRKKITGSGTNVAYVVIRDRPDRAEEGTKPLRRYKGKGEDDKERIHREEDDSAGKVSERGLVAFVVAYAVAAKTPMCGERKLTIGQFDSSTYIGVSTARAQPTSTGSSVLLCQTGLANGKRCAVRKGWTSEADLTDVS